MSFALRAPGQADVVFTVGAGSSELRFELHRPSTVGVTAAMTMRAAHRLLVLWGRRPPVSTCWRRGIPPTWKR
ncbi:MAG: hypothetical protein AVDCRST_MAG50-590 [uncultured Acidimicrobiales bacterium]|uniref:Uncharacterized protein n=1 Tax=uncultured Acidimicrobiales bacterium TaxID=310071 RepID=A0A6J4HD91_9ACTN|nr:MAG: hypothetical protein AVDCRST_MAG50-590 [uncultured Acidimicrobiales bacterium]